MAGNSKREVDGVQRRFKYQRLKAEALFPNTSLFPSSVLGSQEHLREVLWVGNMEEEIWSRLPLELVMVVLACLPYRSLARFKSVCKLWNSLPSTACFQQLCQHLPLHQDSYLLVFDSYIRQNVCPHMSYAPTTRRWDKIALKLPEENFVNRVRAADGGLFCVTGKGNCDFSCTVYNPLLTTFRQLPALPHTSTHFDGESVNMIVDRCSNTYKVLVIRNDGDDDGGGRWRTDMYDSTCECWTETGNMSSITFPRCSGSVICGPTLFALFCTPDKANLDRHENDIVMACDIGTGVWTKVAARMPPFGGCWYCPLVESEGRLLLVGSPRDQIHPSPTVCVWELKVSTASAEWLEIARTEIAGTRGLAYMQVVIHVEAP